jgi:hypothetical protein
MNSHLAGLETGTVSPPVPVSVVFTVYCHIHIESGRRYVGLTKLTMKKRWNRHVYHAMRSSGVGRGHFQNVIRKYGKDAFSHEVLEVCTDLEVANLAEQCWIEFYDTRNPLKGFNLMKGGGHTPHPVKNPWLRPGFREKQMEAVRIAKQDPAERARLSATSKALWQDPAFRQKVVDNSKAAKASPEIVGKMSAAQRRRFEDPDQVRKSRNWAVSQWDNPDFRKSFEDRWKDPVFVSKCSSGLRTGAAMRSARTHCPKGHERTPENTIVSRTGKKSCHPCVKERGRALMRKKRAAAREVRESMGSG